MSKSAPTSECLISKDNGGVLTLTLNQPENRNALQN